MAQYADGREVKVGDQVVLLNGSKLFMVKEIEGEDLIMVPLDTYLYKASGEQCLHVDNA